MRPGIKFKSFGVEANLLFILSYIKLIYMNEIITHRPKKELQADHAWRLYSSLQEMIQFADYKIYLLYMIAGFILTIIFSEYKELIAQGMVFKMCFVLLLILSALLIYFSIMTVMPRSAVSRHLQGQKLIFFMDIASQQNESFAARFIDLPTDQITADLLVQVSVLSNILKEKFNQLKKAMWSFYAILFIILIMQIIKVFRMS